jgi:hypothetical protein
LKTRETITSAEIENLLRQAVKVQTVANCASHEWSVLSGTCCLNRCAMERRVAASVDPRLYVVIAFSITAGVYWRRLIGASEKFFRQRGQ